MKKTISEFRKAFYQNFIKRADTLFNLVDALTVVGRVSSPVALSEETPFARNAKRPACTMVWKTARCNPSTKHTQSMLSWNVFSRSTTFQRKSGIACGQFAIAGRSGSQLPYERHTALQGYVANLAETCDPENELQLITKVQVVSNNVADSQLLKEHNLRAAVEASVRSLKHPFPRRSITRARQVSYDLPNDCLCDACECSQDLEVSNHACEKRRPKSRRGFFWLFSF